MFDVSSISWGPNGSTLAVGYGKWNHTSWCEDQSVVSIWCIFRRDFDHDKPNVNIDVGSCVTSLAFHPSNPSILAGGTFNGEIYLWDVFKNDPVICVSRIDEFYHWEAVTQLLWITHKMYGGYQNVHYLISTSTDGKIMVWEESSKL